MLVGEFGSAVEAGARLGPFDPDAELSARFPGWAEVGRFAGAAEALIFATQWDERGFRVRIELAPDVEIDVDVFTPALARRDWRELIWFHDLPFDPVAVARRRRRHGGGGDFARRPSRPGRRRRNAALGA